MLNCNCEDTHKECCRPRKLALRRVQTLRLADSRSVPSDKLVRLNHEPLQVLNINIYKHFVADDSVKSIETFFVNYSNKSNNELF